LNNTPEKGRPPELPPDYSGPITPDDRIAFETFGLKWPEAPQETEWIDEFQQYVDIGGLAINAKVLNGPVSEGEIYRCRMLVLEAFTDIGYDRNDALLSTTSTTLIENVRMLFANRHRIDPVKLFEMNGNVLRAKAAATEGQLDNFEKHGLNAQKVAEIAISMSKTTFDMRLRSIRRVKFPGGRKLNAVNAVTRSPTLITKKLSELQRRANNLVDLGLDAAHVADSFPEVLLYLPASLRTKFFVLESAFRYWGAADARKLAIAVVDKMPDIISKAPYRLRTVARILSEVLPPTAMNADDLTINALRGLLMQKLERLVATYLHHKNLPDDERQKLETLVNFQSRVRSTVEQLGMTGVGEIIDANPDDKIVAYYRKSRKKPAKRGRRSRKD